MSKLSALHISQEPGGNTWSPIYRSAIFIVDMFGSEAKNVRLHNGNDAWAQWIIDDVSDESLQMMQDWLDDHGDPRLDRIDDLSYARVITLTNELTQEYIDLISDEYMDFA